MMINRDREAPPASFGYGECTTLGQGLCFKDATDGLNANDSLNWIVDTKKMAMGKDIQMSGTSRPPILGQGGNNKHPPGRS